MQAKVGAAIERLDYRPRTSARAMRGKSCTIGVMILEMSSPLQPEIVQGITDELGPTPFQEILVVPGKSPQRQQRSIEALIDRQVDGLILIAPWTAESYLEELSQSMPTVAIARHGSAASYDTVVDDDFAGAGLMVDYLVSLGHTRIAHTSMPSGGLKRPYVLSHTARSDGYIRAMKRHKLTPDVIVTTYSEQGGYDAASKPWSGPSRRPLSSQAPILRRSASPGSRGKGYPRSGGPHRHRLRQYLRLHDWPRFFNHYRPVRPSHGFDGCETPPGTD